MARMAGTTKACRFLFNKASAMIRDKVVPFDDAGAWEAKAAQRRKAFHDKHGPAAVYKETERPWLNFIYLRNHLVKNDGAFVNEHPWLRDVANATRQIAVKEALTAHKAALSNLKAGNIRRFDTPFR